MADIHPEPMRVSCVQTGSFAGDLCSTAGQLPFRPDVVVREEQPRMTGYVPLYGRVEVTMRGTISQRSMVAFWMSGFEDQPDRSGEICVAEIFGAGVRDSDRGPSCEVGMGIHRFRDPMLREDFETPRLDLDVADEHAYAVDWRPGSAVVSVDGREIGRYDQAPDYPMQLMIGVFDFPDRTAGGDDHLVPELVVRRVSGSPVPAT